MEEIKEVVWSCGDDKNLGPDGFNFNFFKNFWDLLKDEIYAFVHEFSVNASLPKAVTTSFLELIPKINNPLFLKDYRPICLIDSMYKIISKLFAVRVKKVLGKLISWSQTDGKLMEGV